MTLDFTMDEDNKIKYLSSILHKTLASKEASVSPTPLYEADHKSWNSLKLAMVSLENHLGNYDASERILREMDAHAITGPDGKKNMSALHGLAGVLEMTGNYAQAEQTAKETLPWLQQHPMLGRDAPQALGSMRMIARAIWKQRRYEEAEEWIERTRRYINDMSAGKFGKYEDDEREALYEDRMSLEKWRNEHEGGDK
jgi:hypothetical protein